MRILAFLIVAMLCANAKSQDILPVTDDGVYFNGSFPTSKTMYDACEILELGKEFSCVTSTVVATAFIVKVTKTIDSNRPRLVEYYGVINIVNSNLHYSFSDYRVDSMQYEKWVKIADKHEVDFITGQIMCHTVFTIARLKGNLPPYSASTQP